MARLEILFDLNNRSEVQRTLEDLGCSTAVADALQMCSMKTQQDALDFWQESLMCTTEKTTLNGMFSATETMEPTLM